MIFVLFYILCAMYQLFLCIRNLIALLKRITYSIVYDIQLVINTMTEVVLHGLGFAQQLLSIAVTLLTLLLSLCNLSQPLFLALG